MKNIKQFDEFIEDQNYETIDELLQTVYTDEMLLDSVYMGWVTRVILGYFSFNC